MGDERVDVWARDGAPCVRAGRGFRWRERDVLEWLEQRRVA
jgi:hypothetical protein